MMKLELSILNQKEGIEVVAAEKKKEELWLDPIISSSDYKLLSVAINKYKKQGIRYLRSEGKRSFNLIVVTILRIGASLLNFFLCFDVVNTNKKYSNLLSKRWEVSNLRAFLICWRIQINMVEKTNWNQHYLTGHWSLKVTIGFYQVKSSVWTSRTVEKDKK